MVFQNKLEENLICGSASFDGGDEDEHTEIDERITAAVIKLTGFLIAGFCRIFFFVILFPLDI